MVTKAATWSARETARLIASKTGRPINDKRVRQWVRDHIDAFDDDAYTSHQYSTAMRDRIIAGMTKAAGSARAVAASSGRTKATKATKAPSKATKATKAPSKATKATKAPSKVAAPVSLVPASNAVPTPKVTPAP